MEIRKAHPRLFVVGGKRRLWRLLLPDHATPFLKLAEHAVLLSDCQRSQVGPPLKHGNAVLPAVVWSIHPLVSSTSLV